MAKAIKKSQQQKENCPPPTDEARREVDPVGDPVAGLEQVRALQFVGCSRLPLNPCLYMSSQLPVTLQSPLPVAVPSPSTSLPSSQLLGLLQPTDKQHKLLGLGWCVSRFLLFQITTRTMSIQSAASRIAKSATKPTTKSTIKPIARPSAARAKVTQAPTQVTIGQVTPIANGLPPPASATQVGATPSLPASQPTSAATAKRIRAPTKRLADSTNQAIEDQAARVAAKAKKARRAEARIQQEELDATVEQAGDSEEIRLLKGE
jgi:hypothetical protein